VVVPVEILERNIGMRVIGAKRAGDAQRRIWVRLLASAAQHLIIDDGSSTKDVRAAAPFSTWLGKCATEDYVRGRAVRETALHKWLSKSSLVDLASPAGTPHRKHVIALLLKVQVLACPVGDVAVYIDSIPLGTHCDYLTKRDVPMGRAVGSHGAPEGAERRLVGQVVEAHVLDQNVVHSSPGTGDKVRPVVATLAVIRGVLRTPARPVHRKRIHAAWQFEEGAAVEARVAVWLAVLNKATAVLIEPLPVDVDDRCVVVHQKPLAQALDRLPSVHRRDGESHLASCQVAGASSGLRHEERLLRQVLALPRRSHYIRAGRSLDDDSRGQPHLLREVIDARRETVHPQRAIVGADHAVVLELLLVARPVLDELNPSVVIAIEAVGQRRPWGQRLVAPSSIEFRPGWRRWRRPRGLQ